MKAIIPYLNFDGQTEEAMLFYKSVFGGEFMGQGIMYMGDVPGMDNLPEEEKKRVMHVTLSLGNGWMLMASDTLPSMGHKLVKGNNHYILLSPDSKAEADRIFQFLAEGGKVQMPMQDQFWGDYYGIVVDKFGIQWMINYSSNS
ncbi:VOC family protein [Thermoflavifilum thermophilum]|uniref:PhnB protein n=1 Tax=Thermoflavifilum thermophilum TaxID=1393122 RepID=A0A1I7NJX9_9BACT|nr:VOC family protein [Thermoflavifilum thermophilum]SFV34971.1 PhnB protein [Thermoflavifilum thermophilum]